MRKQEYKPLGRTIVTEIKHFLVDTVRKSAQGAFRVATRVTEANLIQQDVTIGPDNPYILQDVHHVVSISVPHPIRIELVSHGLFPEPEKRTEQVFSDATLAFDPVFAGRFLSVNVKDPDIFSRGPLTVYVQNMRTGEAENVSLDRLSQGVFSGFIQTQNNDIKGVDFDGVLYCQKDDIIEAVYTEPFSATGESREVLERTSVGLNFEFTTIEAPSEVLFGKFFGFKIHAPIVSSVVLRNARTGHVIHASTFIPASVGLTTSDSGNSFDVMDNDVITITTKGKTINGTIQDVVAQVTVSGVAVQPVISANSLHDIREPFTFEISDSNMPASPNAVINNPVTQQTITVPLVETFPDSGKYKGTVPSLTSVGLPGQPLSIVYTSNEKTASKNINTIMDKTPSCVEVVTDSAIASAPVVLTVKDHFFLNGAFAGTMKLIADEEVRVTLIKA